MIAINVLKPYNKRVFSLTFEMAVAQNLVVERVLQKLKNLTSLSTQCSSSIKLELNDLCLRQTLTLWNLKYSKYSDQNLENSSPNLRLNLKNGRNFNLLTIHMLELEVQKIIYFRVNCGPFSKMSILITVIIQRLQLSKGQWKVLSFTITSFLLC